MQIQPATRQGVIPLISLYSESGCGKTYSSLLLARGLAGPTGKIVGIDTESRRMSLYADVIQGGFDVLNLDAPFTPQRYMEALQTAFDAKPAVVVTDSFSHEWEGLGGVCDMAAEREEKSGRAGLHNWKDPKLQHAKLVQFLLRSPVPVICCIRAKYKTRQKKDEKGKTVIVKDEFTSPIQAEDFIYESTCHAEVLPDHSINLTKCSHPSLRECFPKTGPIEVKHGEMLRQWCDKPGASLTPTSTDPLAAFRKSLWDACKPFRGNDKPVSWSKAESWLIEKAILAAGQKVSDFTTQDQFMTAIDKVGLTLNPPQ